MVRIIRGSIIIIMVITVSVTCTSDNQAKTYYISPDGNDENTGLSKNAAWASIERINKEIYRPGDAILFRSGGTWEGQLRPQGSGTPGKQITISSFGEGPRPIINIGENPGTGIQLVNQSWWEIQGIEITSGVQPESGFKRGGILATSEGEDQHIEHIVIRDCYIHDIWGQVGGDKTSVAIYVGPLVPFQTDGEISKNCSATDVLIENNKIIRVDKIGIFVWGNFPLDDLLRPKSEPGDLFLENNNIIVRGNFLENIGGDAIIVFGAQKGLIERNIADRTCLRTGDPYLDTGKESRYSWWPHTAAIWLAGCNETIMQFNEVSNTGRQPANGDGEAFDFDFGCTNCLLQYNYSRYNAGFLLIMDNTFRNIARYNISENDCKFRPTHLVNMFCDTTEQNLIHNNIFYVNYGTADIDYYYGDEYGPGKGKGKKEKGKLGAHFRNNIFFATGQGRFRTVYSYGDSLNSAEFRKLDASVKLPQPVPGTGFYHNCYFGPWLNGLPHDIEAITEDPLFVAPGTGGSGFSTLDGYKLRNESPCINAGVFIDCKQDFFGNMIYDLQPDIGIYERVSR